MRPTFINFGKGSSAMNKLFLALICLLCLAQVACGATVKQTTASTDAVSDDAGDEKTAVLPSVISAKVQKKSAKINKARKVIAGIFWT